MRAPESCQKCHHFAACVGASATYFGERKGMLTKKRENKRKKERFTMHASLWLMGGFGETGSLALLYQKVLKHDILSSMNNLWSAVLFEKRGCYGRDAASSPTQRDAHRSDPNH
jgi:hypothetical protein